MQIPIDAVPDMTNVQVLVITEAPGCRRWKSSSTSLTRSNRRWAGCPHVMEARSVSKFGISVVTIVFRRGDRHLPRAAAGQRTADAGRNRGSRESTPRPNWAPLATALGESLAVRGAQHADQAIGTPMELRTLARMGDRAAVAAGAGVTEINSHGGFYKSYEVQLDPNRMAAGAGRAGRSDRGPLEQQRQRRRRLHRARRRAAVHSRRGACSTMPRTSSNVVVRAKGGDLPILVKTSPRSPSPRSFARAPSTRDGRGEVVTGMVMMLLGENSRTVVQRAKERLEEIAKATLPRREDRSHSTTAAESDRPHAPHRRAQSGRRRRAGHRRAARDCWAACERD